mgnify:CR=1 FL=1
MKETKPIKILFAEDLSTDAEMALRVIRSEKIEFDFRIVMEERDFRRELIDFKPDIVVSDYSMPAFDGMTALNIIRAHSMFLPFIVLTGSMNEETAVACMKAGANDYVIKEQIKRLPFAILEAIEKSNDRREKEKIQQQLRESENKFRSVLQSANDAIISADTKGIIVGWNSGAEKMFGFTEEEITGKNIATILPDIFTDEQQNWIKKQVRGGKGFGGRTIEFEGIHKESKHFPIELSLANWESSGEMFFTAVVRDITERKKAELTLKENEQRFRMIFESVSNVAVHGYHSDGKIIFWNKACEIIYGYAASDAIGSNFYDLIIPEKQVSVAKTETQRMFETGIPAVSEERELKRKNGENIHVYSSYAIINLPNNQSEVYCIDIDLSELKMAEQQLRLLSRSVEQSPVSIVITDKQGNIEYVNSAFSEITGYTREEAIGQNPKILKSGHHENEHYKKLWGNILQGKDWKGEILNKTKSGKLIWEDVNISPVTDEYGAISHFVAIKEDITQKKKIIEELTAAKEKAEESDHLKSAFLANMSHEIRTPMNGILGFTELLSDSNFSGEEKQNFIKIIQKSGQRMLNTVNDLIDISKIETGQMSVVLTPANVKEILFSQYCFFQPEAEEKKLKFVLNDQIQQTEALVSTDVVKLDSILTNLIKNALKYTDLGSVEIGCNKQDNKLYFYVKDTGIGIPENRQAAVFNRFEQADVGDKRAYQGSGLGLTIAKAYVEMLGGKMELDSKIGYGSTFSFFIPAGETTGEVITEPEISPKEEKLETFEKLKILIAEDDSIAFQYLKAVLSEIPCEISYAANGQEAVEFFKNNHDIDLILMDIRMPVMDGYQATRKIREINSQVYIIAQTAFALAGDREKTIDAGCNDYLSKPVNKTELLDKIKEFVRTKKSSKAD